MLERSRAIKCPNVFYQLAGTKKVQQVLAKPGVVERFITDQQAANRIRSTFAGQYSLDLVCDSSLHLNQLCNIHVCRLGKLK